MIYRNAEEMKAHWAEHEKKNQVNRKNDPRGLQNACIPTEPLWLNQYHDVIQTRVFDRLMRKVDVRGWAYDIGCGSGRWTRRVRAWGFPSIGIDLQETLIHKNMFNEDGCYYANGSFLDYTPPQLTGLATSVTVLQHIPYNDQLRAFEKIYSVLEKDGYLLMLENTSFKSDTVFSHPPLEWVDLAERAGFVFVKHIAYDRSLFLRIAEKMPFYKTELKWMSVPLDLLVEKLWPFSWGSRHGGFLFRKF